MDQISIIFGEKNLNEFVGVRYRNLSIHSNAYDPFTLTGDICLIKVYLNSGDELNLNPLRMVVDENTAINENCYIYGYGSEELFGRPTLELRLAPVVIVPLDICIEQLGPYNAPTVDSGMFCASGAQRNADACKVNTKLG